MGKYDDFVEVFERTDGRFDWRRKNGRNGDVVSTSGNQGYESRDFAFKMARTMNPGIEVT